MPDEPTKLQQNVNRYLSLVVLFLLIIAPPILCSLFYLSQVPDVTWERNDGLTIDRIWLYRDRRPVGIGYQSQRVTAEYSRSEVCVQTKLRFLLWGKSGRATPATTSRMLVRVDNRWQPSGEPCR